MGVNQSKPSDSAIQEKLMERLQAMHIKEDRPINEKEGYVYVESDPRMSIPSPIKSYYQLTNKGPPRYTATHRQDVSAEAIGAWEKELLEDPKARHHSHYFTRMPSNIRRTGLLWPL